MYYTWAIRFEGRWDPLFNFLQPHVVELTFDNRGVALSSVCESDISRANVNHTKVQGRGKPVRTDDEVAG